MNYYLEALKKYADFSGRATRAQYWYFVLFNIIIALLIGIIAGVTGMADSNGNSILNSLYSLVIVVPSLAVGVRRMHDVDKSGWFILIPLYNLVLFATEGTKGVNKYGTDPKAENVVTA